MSRFQSRRGNGQWQRNTLENTFGLHGNHCQTCGCFSPSRVGEPLPDVCQHCGAILATCAHGRCADAFPDPFVMNRGGYRECGKPAVAFDVERHWPMCADHIETEPAEPAA